MFKNFFKRNQPQSAPKRVIETTLGDLYQALKAGILLPDNAKVITRLGTLEWVDVRRVPNSFDVLVAGDAMVNMLAGYEQVFVEVQ